MKHQKREKKAYCSWFLKKDDKIDQFLKKAEDPNWWRTIRDELNQKDIVLTDE